jgi:hypothetical protein
MDHNHKLSLSMLNDIFCLVIDLSSQISIVQHLFFLQRLEQTIVTATLLLIQSPSESMV